MCLSGCPSFNLPVCHNTVFSGQSSCPGELQIHHHKELGIGTNDTKDGPDNVLLVWRQDTILTWTLPLLLRGVIRTLSNKLDNSRVVRYQQQQKSRNWEYRHEVLRDGQGRLSLCSFLALWSRGSSAEKLINGMAKK